MSHQLNWILNFVAVAFSLGCMGITFFFHWQYGSYHSAILRAKEDARVEAKGDFEKYKAISAQKGAVLPSPEVYYQRARFGSSCAIAIWIFSIVAAVATRRWMPLLLTSVFTYLSVFIIARVRY